MMPSWGGASFLPCELANVPNMNMEEEEGVGPLMSSGFKTVVVALSSAVQRSSALTVKPPRGVVGNPMHARQGGVQ